MKKVVLKKKIRRNRVLRLLADRGELSLTELSYRTGMSLPMVSRLAAELQRERLISVKARQNGSKAGRPPIIAHLNGEAGFVIGIDMGHQNTNMVLLNLERKIVAEQTMPTVGLSNEPCIVDWLKESVDVVLRKASVRRSRLLGVGLSLPGIVRGREGRSETYLNFGTSSTKEVLQSRFKIPVHIEHDAKAMALGEKWFGAAAGKKSVLTLNLGWGVGLGILIDGKIYYGKDGYAGEFGHIEIVSGGRLCYCGKRGCLETVASGMAIEIEAREKLKNGATSKLRKMAGRSLANINAAMVVQAATEGDVFSIEILERAGRYLGQGIAQLINLFNPEVIILGGRVSRAQQFILGAVRSTATKLSLTQLNKNVEFITSSLGTNAGALGVAMLATSDLFEVDHLNPSALV